MLGSGDRGGIYEKVFSLMVILKVDEVLGLTWAGLGWTGPGQVGFCICCGGVSWLQSYYANSDHLSRTYICRR